MSKLKNKRERSRLGDRPGAPQVESRRDPYRPSDSPRRPVFRESADAFRRTRDCGSRHPSELTRSKKSWAPARLRGLPGDDAHADASPRRDGPLREDAGARVARSHRRDRDSRLNTLATSPWPFPRARHRRARHGGRDRRARRRAVRSRPGRHVRRTNRVHPHLLLLHPQRHTRARITRRDRGCLRRRHQPRARRRLQRRMPR